MTVATLPVLFTKPPEEEGYSAVAANTVNDWVAASGAGEFGEAFGMQEEVAEEFAGIVEELALIAGQVAGVGIAAGAGTAVWGRQWRGARGRWSNAGDEAEEVARVRVDGSNNLSAMKCGVWSGQPNVGGKVIAWSGTAFTLSVSSGTLSTNYNGGTLNVAGVTATITTVSGTNVVNVTAAPTIPFVLHDDDAASHPYQPDTSLMQASDSTNENLFAAAYIRPAYDLGGGATTNAFKRNVESSADATTQLTAGRDSTSYPRYWTVYVQGAFQGMTQISFPGVIAGDSDPNSEAGVLGIAPGLNSSGALVFVETIRDSEINSGIPAGHLLRKTTAHETGHQFGLDHENNSIMQQGYPVPLLFAPRHIDDMRKKANP